MLRKRQMLGFKFRRERSILNYIADFACLELLLIIEIDGITHLSKEALIKDKERDSILKSVGFTTIRFTDNEVLESPDAVRLEIETWINNNS